MGREWTEVEKSRRRRASIFPGRGVTIISGGIDYIGALHFIKSFDLIDEVLPCVPSEICYLIAKFVGKKIHMPRVKDVVKYKNHRNEKHFARHYLLSSPYW